MTSPVDWGREFQEFPPTFHRVLADLMQEVAAERARESKGAKVRHDMQAIVDVVYPKRSMKPFAEALWDATDMTLRAVAQYAGFNPGALHHLLNGKKPLTKDKIERIAKAIHVDPGYFVEYRRMVIHEAVDALLDPHRSLQIYAAMNRGPKPQNEMRGTR